MTTLTTMMMKKMTMTTNTVLIVLLMLAAVQVSLSESVSSSSSSSSSGASTNQYKFSSLRGGGRQALPPSTIEVMSLQDSIAIISQEEDGNSNNDSTTKRKQLRQAQGGEQEQAQGLQRRVILRRQLVQRKLLSKRRYFARYSSQIGRDSVQRCVNATIIEDDDNTLYTVFEVDINTNVEIEIDIEIEIDDETGEEIQISSSSSSSSSLLEDENKEQQQQQGEETKINVINEDDNRCISSLHDNNDILDVEEDRPVKILQDTSSSSSSTTEETHHSWGIKAIQADQLPPGPNKVTVCVVDTGIAIDHPGLNISSSSSRSSLESSSSTSGVGGGGGEVDPSRIRGSDSYGLLYASSNSRVMQWNHDNNGHGTHVAGIILDVVDSGSSSSSGNNVDLFVVSAFDDDNVGYESDVVRAIRTCVEQGKADVVNLSLGNAYAPSQFTSDLYASIVENYGAMLIAAAGNEDSEAREGINYYPAYHPSVVSVGAIMEDGMLLPNSVRNEQVEIVAPGAEIVSTSVNYGDGSSGVQYGYERRSGTSAAAPHVTGAVALLKSHFPNCSNRQLRYAMAKSAVRNVIKNDAGQRDGLLMLSTLKDEQDVVDNSTIRDNAECDSTKGYGNIQVRDTLDWLLVQGGCDYWDTAYDSRGGCTTLEGGIVRIDYSDADDEEDETNDDGNDEDEDDEGNLESEETETKDEETVIPTEQEGTSMSFQEALASIYGVTIKPINEEESEEESNEQEQTGEKVVEDGSSENEEEDVVDIENIEVDEEVLTTSDVPTDSPSTGLDEPTSNDSTDAPTDSPIEDSTPTDEPVSEPTAAPINVIDDVTTNEPTTSGISTESPTDSPTAAPINVIDDVTTNEPTTSGISTEDTKESPTDSPTPQTIPPVEKTSGTDEDGTNVEYDFGPFFFGGN